MECPAKTFPFKFVVHRVLIGATHLHTLSAELLHPTETIVKWYIYIGKWGEVHHCATFEVGKYRNEGKRSNLFHKQIRLLVNNFYTILYENRAKGFKILHNVLFSVIYFLLYENRAKGFKDENYFNKFSPKKYRVWRRLYFRILLLLRLDSYQSIKIC